MVFRVRAVMPAGGGASGAAASIGSWPVAKTQPSASAACL